MSLSSYNQTNVDLSSYPELESWIECVVLTTIAHRIAGIDSYLTKFIYKILLNLRNTRMSDIESRVKAIVAEQLDVDIAEVKTDSSFVDDLGADSLDTVELVMALEEEFDAEIPDDEAEKITTVQLAVDYINKSKA